MDQDGGDEADRRFRRLFSKQLAEALRANDEEEAAELERRKVASASGRSLRRDDAEQRERSRSTYAELCYDDPVVSGGDAACRGLARALVPKRCKTSKNETTSGKDASGLALSSRLVSGTLQATSRAAAKAKAAASSSSASPNAAAVNPDQEPMFGSSSVATSEGYAEVAFAIFVEGPYRCLQRAEDLPTASRFLGSFRPPDASDTPNATLTAGEQSRLADEAAAKIVRGMEAVAMDGKEKPAGDDSSSSSSEFFRPNAARGAQPTRDDDSLEEIFAEESDPDDYEYGSSYNPYASESNAEVDDFGFDPIRLSEPDATNRTWEGARKSIHYLLSGASYSKLALGALSSRAWSDGGMSETLADLCFMLLLERTKRDRGDGPSDPNSLLHETRSEEGIASLWAQPLFLLRDRALDRSRGHDALPSYLQLLTAFLSHSEQDVMSILSSPPGKSTSEDALPPITAVGLSSLATLCASEEMVGAAAGRTCGTSVWSVRPREEAREAVRSSLGPLARIVECVRPRKSLFAKGGSVDRGGEEGADESWIRTAVCVMPMVEYLANVRARFDFRPLFEGGGGRFGTLSDSDAKAITDSGLFREMVSLCTSTSNENDSLNTATPRAEDVVRLQLLRTIFMLSALSPELLGRFAMRVPEFAKEVHSSAFMGKHLVDGILWTSIGSSLLENTSDASKPRLKLRTKSKPNAKGPVDAKSLAERSVAGFETMCQSSTKALQRLKQSVRNAESLKAEYGGCKDALDDIGRFSNCLSNCPSATKMWLDSLKNHEGSTQRAASVIAQLKATLATLPSFSIEIDEAPPHGHKKDDDDRAESPSDESNEDGPKVQTLQQLRKDCGLIVASIRSSTKVIALALESQKGAGLSLKGPPCDISSKTD